MATPTKAEAELIAKIQSLELQIAKQPKPREVTVKISDNTGAIVVSGLAGRYPTTLYRSSWHRLLSEEITTLILTFIKDNDEAITKAMTKAGKVDH